MAVMYLFAVATFASLSVTAVGTMVSPFFKPVTTVAVGVMDVVPL